MNAAQTGRGSAGPPWHRGSTDRSVPPATRGPRDEGGIGGCPPMSVFTRTVGKQARSPRHACRSILVAELTPILVAELTWITHERRR